MTNEKVEYWWAIKDRLEASSGTMLFYNKNDAHDLEEVVVTPKSDYGAMARKAEVLDELMKESDPVHKAYAYFNTPTDTQRFIEVITERLKS